MTEQDSFSEEIHAFRSALVDPVSQESRLQAARLIAANIRYIGRIAWVGTDILRKRDWEGLTLVIQMAGELANGAVTLFEQENWYAGSTLVRQLIETEYFLWRFSRDRAESSTWLRATAEELRKEFQPQRMRKIAAGLFRDTEYWIHCSQGGHPHPEGRRLLPDHGHPLGTKLGCWADLVQHLERVWRHLGECFKTYNFAGVVPAEIILATDDAIREWRAHDLVLTLDLS